MPDFTTMDPDEFRRMESFGSMPRLVDTDRVAILSTSGAGVYVGQLRGYPATRSGYVDSRLPNEALAALTGGIQPTLDYVAGLLDEIERLRKSLARTADAGRDLALASFDWSSEVAKELLELKAAVGEARELLGLPKLGEAK